MNETEELVEPEPEFWTILKTPYVRREQFSPVTLLLVCDGYSSIYSFQGVYPIYSAKVLVNDNGRIITTAEYVVSVMGTEGRVMFNTPPRAGTFITVYF